MSDIETREQNYIRHEMRARIFNLLAGNNDHALRPPHFTARCSHYAETIENIVTAHRCEPAAAMVVPLADTKGATVQPIDPVSSAALEAVEAALAAPQFKQAAE